VVTNSVKRQRGILRCTLSVAKRRYDPILAYVASHHNGVADVARRGGCVAAYSYGGVTSSMAMAVAIVRIPLDSLWRVSMVSWRDVTGGARIVAVVRAGIKWRGSAVANLRGRGRSAIFVRTPFGIIDVT